MTAPESSSGMGGDTSEGEGGSGEEDQPAPSATLPAFGARARALLLSGMSAARTSFWGLGVKAIAVFLVIGLIGVLLFRRVPEAPAVDCSLLRTAEERASRMALVPIVEANLDGDLLAMDVAVEALLSSPGNDAAYREISDQLTAINQELAAEEARLASAEGAGLDTAPITTRITELRSRASTSREQLTRLDQERLELDRGVGLAMARAEATLEQLIELYPEQDEMIAAYVPGGAREAGAGPGVQLIFGAMDRLHELESAAPDPESGESGPIVGERLVPVGTNRPPVSVQADELPARMHFGSRRDSKRQEIILSKSEAPPLDESGSLAVDGTVGDEVRLPDQATYLAAVGQFSSIDGDEIPPGDITVWARRLGSHVLLNVCIDPDDELAAGTYSGDVYLVDPSLSPIRVPVEVTAQFRWIEWLYFLLPVFPCLALLYVWYTARLAADRSAWEIEPFKRWAKRRFLLLFGVGFASVWATLQIAFNDPTWGSTLFGSVAVIAGGLAAAVTAMTALAGTVIGRGVDEDADRRTADR